MTVAEMTSLVSTGMRLGLTAAGIVEEICNAHGGETVPDMADFDAHTDALRAMADLTPKAEDK